MKGEREGERQTEKSYLDKECSSKLGVRGGKRFPFSFLNSLAGLIIKLTKDIKI